MNSKSSPVLLSGVRVVPLDAEQSRHSDHPTDVLLDGGRIVAVGPSAAAARPARTIQADGRWLIPGLWDHHVHFSQWVQRVGRLDLSQVESAAQTVAVVAEHVAAGAQVDDTGFLTGWGYRTGTWSEPASVAALDEVTGAMPVVLISGDGHNGWLNSAALRRLGLEPREGVLTETEWFEAHTRLGVWPGATEAAEAGVPAAVTRMAARGVVGIVDLEFARTWEQWQRRHAAGVSGLRVRTGVYADRVEEVLDAGWRTGDAIPGAGPLVRMGPLKVIADGSLNTRTAWCCEPYADVVGHTEEAIPLVGAPNQSFEELRDLVQRAHRGGLEAALHAIGDRAVAEVLEVFAATGARGSIEHAQLVRPQDLHRWRDLPVRASVQPAHLLDDREVTEQCWPDRSDRTFVLRTMLDQGIEVVLGSDAPVASLDPWLAMSAAVYRGQPGQEPWHPEQSITVLEALRASVDGRRVAVDEPADLVLLDADPLAPGSPQGQAAALRQMPVAATLVAGEVTWSDGGLAGR